MGEAAAAKGQGAINALDIDGSSFGFDRVRSRPAKIIKGAKKAAYYPKMRYVPLGLARRLASPLFLPATTSYHEVLTVAQHAESNAARSEAEAAHLGKGQLYGAPRLALPPKYTLPLFFLAAPLDGAAAAEV